MTFDRAIDGLQPISTILMRENLLDKLSFWCGGDVNIALSRVLEMCYTKASRKTEILMHKLTVDVRMEGFNEQFLPITSVPPQRIILIQGEEE